MHEWVWWIFFLSQNHHQNEIFASNIISIGIFNKKNPILSLFFCLNFYVNLFDKIKHKFCRIFDNIIWIYFCCFPTLHHTEMVNITAAFMLFHKSLLHVVYSFSLSSCFYLLKPSFHQFLRNFLTKIYQPISIIMKFFWNCFFIISIINYSLPCIHHYRILFILNYFFY